MFSQKELVMIRRVHDSTKSTVSLASIDKSVIELRSRPVMH